MSNRNVRKARKRPRKSITSNRISGNTSFSCRKYQLFLLATLANKLKIGIQKLSGPSINTTVVTCFSSLKYVVITNIYSSKLKNYFQLSVSKKTQNNSSVFFFPPTTTARFSSHSVALWLWLKIDLLKGKSRHHSFA